MKANTYHNPPKKLEDFPTVKEVEEKEKRRIIRHLSTTHIMVPHNVNEMSFYELREFHREAHSDDINWANNLAVDARRAL